MRLKKSTLITLTACIAGAALLFGYFSYQKKDTPSPAEPETTTNEPPPPASSSRYQPAESTTAAAPAEQNTAGQTYKPDESDSSNALPDETGTAEQVAPEECADSACAERVLAFLDDPANDEAAKVKMAQTWLKPESKEETLSLLRLLKEAHDAQQYDLKDRLLQMLAGADSGESAELLISVLNGEQSDFSLQDLPDDLSYAIKKAVRLNPDENTGKRLAEELSYQRSDETLAAIQDVKHPDMVYQLALEADQRGDTEKVGELVQSLQTFEDPRALEVFARLGKERIVSEDETFSSAADWAEAHQDRVAADKYEAVLSDPAAEPTERIVAAAALTGLENADQALAALQKASDDEADQSLRSYYKMAIDRISRRAGMSTDNGEERAR